MRYLKKSKPFIVFFTGGKNDPSARFRIRHFLPSLRLRGLICLELTSWPAKHYVPNTTNQWLFTILFVFFTILKTITRLIQIPICFFADVVVLQRELVPFGLIPLERFVIVINKNTIFDFDDAIFIYDNKFKKYLEKRQTIPDIVRRSRVIIVGNQYLKEYAIQYNKKTVLIPTLIDTDKYLPSSKKNKQTLTIGWIGTNANIKYLLEIKDALIGLSKECGFRLKIISDCFLCKNELKGIKVAFKKWNQAEEVSDIQSFDIGIMPMPDNAWTKGKCAFKLIQYMSCAVPSIGTRSGANSYVINNEKNGYLASSSQEWLKYFKLLIDNKHLRDKIGNMGRKRIIEEYSLIAKVDLFTNTILGLLDKKNI